MDEVVAVDVARVGASCGLAVDVGDARRRSGMNVTQIVRDCLADTLGRPPSPGVVAHLDAEVRRTLLDRAANFSGLRAAPGAVDLLSALALMGVPVGIVSGLHRPVVDALLQRMGWTRFATCSMSADEVADGRPSPAMIRALMRAVGARSLTRVACVGDSGIDLAAAAAAGCGLTALPRTSRHVAELRDVPDVVLLDGLPDVVRALNGVDAADSGRALPGA